MTIIDHIEKDHCRIWIGKIPEMAAVPENLSREEQTEFDSFHSDKRKKEWLAMRSMIRQIGFDQKITYLPNGKPVVQSGYISLSHGAELVGFLFSDRPTGIDIQDPDDKIVRIRKRFCGAAELDEANRSGNELLYLTQLWCIKEAVFKMYGEHVVFSEEIQVDPFDPIHADGYGVTLLREGKKHRHTLYKHQVDNTFVVYGT